MDKYLLEAAFFPTYPTATLWSSKYHVKVNVVEAAAVPDQHGICPLITEMQQKSHIFDPNLWKRLLLEYILKCKLKLQKWSKLNSGKKSLMTMIYEQCIDARARTEIYLGTNYETVCADGELINFLTILRTVC